MKESLKRALNKRGVEQVPARPCSQECCLLWDRRLTNELFAELGTQWQWPLTLTHTVWGAVRGERRKTCPICAASWLSAPGQTSFVTPPSGCIPSNSTKRRKMAAFAFFLAVILTRSASQCQRVRISITLAELRNHLHNYYCNKAIMSTWKHMTSRHSISILFLITLIILLLPAPVFFTVGANELLMTSLTVWSS